MPFLEVRNSLGVVKRQEKELNHFYDDDDEEGLEEEEEIENVIEQGTKYIFTSFQALCIPLIIF